MAGPGATRRSTEMRQSVAKAGLFFFLLPFSFFTKPGRIPFLPGDGWRGEGRVHASDGYNVPMFCWAIVIVVSAEYVLICMTQLAPRPPRPL